MHRAANKQQCQAAAEYEPTCKNTASRPHVHRGGVQGAAKQQLRRPIPPRKHLCKAAHSRGVRSRSADSQPMNLITSGSLSLPMPTWFVYFRSGLPKMRDKPKSANFKLPAVKVEPQSAASQSSAF